MSDGMNKVFLAGNVCKDPEGRVGQGGSFVLRLRVATNESYLDKNKNRQERTEYHNVVVFGPRGEALSRFMTNGMSVTIEGSLRTSSYEKDGQKRYSTDVIAANVILGGGGGRRGQGAPPPDDGFGAPPPEAPARGGGGGYQRNGAPPVAPPDDGFGAPPGSDEDIPFAYIGAARVSGDRVPRTWL